MEKYNYREAITKDIKDYILSNEIEIVVEEDEFANWLWDELWCEDSVTGNGAYFYDSEEKCSEYLSGNFDLLYEAAREFCIDDDTMLLIRHYENKDLARYFDCTIRCYLLGECIEKALEELK